MQLGKFRIELLETGSFGLDGRAMFGVVPKNLWTKTYAPADEKNRIPMVARALYIEYDDRKILVDTGNGSKLSEKLAAIYNIDHSIDTLERSLARIRLTPGDITDVILTHLHFDHAGGATTLRNGEIEPTFPHARYYIQKEQLEWARNPVEKDRASFMSENYEPLHNAGVLETLDGPGELFPGIELKPIYGHTKGLQMTYVRDGDARLLFPSDLMPTHAHVRVPYVMGYDNYPLSTIEEKKSVLPRVYEEGAIVCFQHDAFRQASKIVNSEKGFTAGEPVVISA